MNGALNGKSIEWNNQGQKLKEEHFLMVDIMASLKHGMKMDNYSQIKMKNDTVHKVIGKWEPDGSPT